MGAATTSVHRKLSRSSGGADGWNNSGLHPKRVPAETKVRLLKEALSEESWAGETPGVTPTRCGQEELLLDPAGSPTHHPPPTQILLRKSKHESARHF